MPPEIRKNETPQEVWDLFHKHDNRLTVLEIHKENCNESMLKLSSRHDKHEEKFEATVIKISDTLIEMKEQFTQFMGTVSAFMLVVKTTEKDRRITIGWMITLGIGLGIPALTVLTYLVNYYITHK